MPGCLITLKTTSQHFSPTHSHFLNMALYKIIWYKFTKLITRKIAWEKWSVPSWTAQIFLKMTWKSLFKSLKTSKKFMINSTNLWKKRATLRTDQKNSEQTWNSTFSFTDRYWISASSARKWKTTTCFRSNKLKVRLNSWLNSFPSNRTNWERELRDSWMEPSRCTADLAQTGSQRFSGFSSVKTKPLKTLSPNFRCFYSRESNQIWSS